MSDNVKVQPRYGNNSLTIPLMWLGMLFFIVNEAPLSSYPVHYGQVKERQSVFSSALLLSFCFV